MQFLCTGHIERGIEGLGELLAEIGETLPRSKVRVIARVLFERARAKWHGRRVHERSESEIDPGALARLDIYRVVGEGFTMVEQLWAAPYTARALTLALTLGEPRRITRGLLYQASYIAAEGKHERARQLLATAQARARHTGDPHLGALAILAEGCVAYYAGDLERARSCFADADELFTDLPGTTLDRNTARYYRLNALRHSGELRTGDALTGGYVQDARRRRDRYAEVTYRRQFEAWVLLARDRPDEVEALLADTRWAPASIGFHVQHWYELWVRCVLALYRVDSADAVDHLRGQLSRFAGAFLFARIQTFRAVIRWLDAQLCLVAPDGNGPQALARAEAKAKALHREKVSYASVYGLLVAAAVAHRRGRDETAATLLRSANDVARDCAMSLHAAAARRRLGELLGGDEGRALVTAAEATFRAQGVVSPDRYLHLYAPGFQPRLDR
jgi:hypothetical protein